MAGEAGVPIETVGLLAPIDLRHYARGRDRASMRLAYRIAALSRMDKLPKESELFGGKKGDSDEDIKKIVDEIKEIQKRELSVE